MQTKVALYAGAPTKEEFVKWMDDHGFDLKESLVQNRKGTEENLHFENRKADVSKHVELIAGTDEKLWKKTEERKLALIVD